MGHVLLERRWRTIRVRSFRAMIDRAVARRSAHFLRMRTMPMLGGRTYTAPYSVWGGATIDRSMEGLASAVPKPSPEPFYTIRPHAGDVTSVEYLDIGTTGGLASGSVHYSRIRSLSAISSALACSSGRVADS